MSGVLHRAILDPMNTERTHTAPIDDRAYCMRCTADDLAYGMLCRRREIFDNGPDRDPGLLARFEGVCIRCCNHNHA